MLQLSETQSLTLILGAICAFACIALDVKRRRLPRKVSVIAAIILVLELAAYLAARSSGATAGNVLLATVVVGAASVFLLSRFIKAKTAILADISANSLAAFATSALFLFLVVSDSVSKSLAIGFAAALLLCIFLWSEGRATMQWQRPDGIASAEFLILAGAASLALQLYLTHRDAAATASLIPGAIIALAGFGLLALVLRIYFSVREERRIISHIGQWGESLQPEYSPATPECPFPERWKMYDTMTAEVEVLDFLTTLVTTLKPNLIVETGTFSGISTLAFAQGLRKNGFGKIISCEFDPIVYAKAKERIAASGLQDWIDLRNESSLEMSVEGTIDLLFSDSDEKIREHEVRKFIHQVNPHGVILMHDASSHYGIVRKGALTLEKEGIISPVLLPTPRGLVFAQKARLSRSTS